MKAPSTLGDTSHKQKCPWNGYGSIYVLLLRVQVVDDDPQAHGQNLKSNGPAIQKGKWLRFEMTFNVPSNHALY